MPTQPQNWMIRDWGTWVENLIQANIVAGSGLIFQTRALLFANLNYPALTMVWVTNDTTPEYNGIYQKQGASGAGLWVRVMDLPFSFIVATDTGAGTPNAIQATSSVPVSGSALVWLTLAQTNTATPVTISFNGGTSLTIKTNAGNNPAIGGLVAGTTIMGIRSGSTFKLISDQASAAIQAACEAAKNAAEAARDVTLAALSSVVVTTFATRSLAAAYSPSVAPDFLQTAGYAAAGDNGGALYRKNGTATGDLVITTSGGSAVGYSIAEKEVVPQQFGAFPGVSVDRQAQLQAWLNYTGGTHRLPAGSWRSDGALTRTADLVLRGSGVLDFSYGASGQLLVQGSITALSAMNANMTKLAKAMSFASAPAVAPGDVIILYNPTDFSFGGRRAVYRDGGMFKVHSLSGSTVKTYEMATDTYTAASMSVYKLNGVSARIEGITFIPCATASNAALSIQYGKDVVIRDCKSGAGGVYVGIEVDKCYNVVIDCCTPENNSPHVNDEYGILLSSSQHVSVRGNAAYATRHAVSIGNYGTVASVPTRYVTIDGMNLWNNPTDQTGAGDCHGNGDYVTYVNCTMAGFSGGGRNIRLKGCTIFGMTEGASGLCVAAPEVNGGYFDMIDCELMSLGDGQSSSHGFIYVQPIGPSGYGYPAQTNIREDLTLRILNCRLVTPNAGALAKAVNVASDNANKKTNVVIDGLQWESPQGLAFLYAADNTLTSFPSDYLIVENVYGPSGAYLVYPTSDVASVNTREMEQSGAVNTAVSSASSVATSASLNFRYPYSRLPTVMASQSSTGGASSATFGGKRTNTFPLAFSSTSITLTTQSADGANFVSNDNVRQHWRAGVFSV